MIREVIYINREQLPKALPMIKDATVGARKAAVLLQTVRAGVSTTVEKDLNDAFAIVCAGYAEEASVKRDEKGMEFMLIAELALIAAELKFSEVARKCCRTLKLAKTAPLAATVMGEVVQARLLVDALGAERELYTQNMLSTRSDALKRLEKTLYSAERAESPEVIQEVCLTIWNLSLPLMQQNTLAYIKRPLSLAAKALADIRSPLHEIRTQMHLELAKCEISDDLLASALMHLRDGLAIEYVVPDDQAAASGGLERPWDRHLRPLYNKLSLKMSLYSSPDRAEDQALLLLDQAKDVPDFRLRLNLLERAYAKLAAAAETAETSGDATSVLGGVAKERTLLWIEMVKCAWGGKVCSIVAKASPVRVRLLSDWYSQVCCCERCATLCCQPELCSCTHVLRVPNRPRFQTRPRLRR